MFGCLSNVAHPGNELIMLRVFGPHCNAAPIEASDVAAIPEDAIWVDLLESTKAEEALAEKLVGTNIPTRAVSWRSCADSRARR